MEAVMDIRTAVAVSIAIAIAAVAAGCRLDPLVDDIPGASGNVLAPGSTVPSAADSPEIANQIALNDGIDDRVLAINGNIIPRGTGASDGEVVRYWSFGLASSAPAPMFEFFRRTGSGLERIDHPAMVESLPGERSYNPLHSVTQVVVTDRYAGELITSADALADAIDLGLVEVPEPAGEFVASPIVMPGTRLEVSDKPGVPAVPAQLVYGHGYVVGMFELGGPRGVQPIGGLLPTSQVSFLRESNKPAYDATRPIFQVGVPANPPPTMPPADYTPLSVVINVDLVPDERATSILRDSDLFVRDDNGMIVSTTNLVEQIQITTTMLVLPIQFEEDAP
jgi:hypothetical protein